MRQAFGVSGRHLDETPCNSMSLWMERVEAQNTSVPGQAVTTALALLD